MFVAVALPLLLAEGLDGLAFGMAATTLVALAFRAYFVHGLFPEVPLLSLALRGALPAAVGAAVVLLADGPPVLEAAAYVVLVGAVTWLLQGGLLREAGGYLGRGTRGHQPGTVLR